MKKRCNQIKQNATTIEQLIAKVEREWDEYDRHTLDYIWAHQYNENLNDLGGNQYQAPHNRSRARHRNNDSAVSLHIIPLQIM